MEDLVALLVRGTELTIWTFIGLCLASFAGSFIASAVGIGGGVFVVATMATVLPPTILIPLHAIVQLGSNVGRAGMLYKHILWTILPAFALGSLIGSVIGARSIVALEPWVLELILGLFVIYAAWFPGFRASQSSKLTFGGAGVVSGFATMFIGGSGPLVAPFVAASTPVRQEFVATHALLMLFQHTVKIFAFGFLGFVFTPYIPFLIGLVSFGFAGTYIGKLILNKLPERLFRIAFKIVLTGLALRLLYSASQKLLS